MTIVYLILGFMIGIILLHFICFHVLSYYRKQTHPNRRIHNGDRFSLYHTSSKSLMVTLSHHSKYDFDDCERHHSHDITLEFGGLMFIYKYGNNFLPDDYWKTHGGDDGSSRYYGLYSLDGEFFWRNIWWGNHIYDNPFIPMKWIGTWVSDIHNNYLINMDTFDKNDPSFPYVLICKNVKYINKHDEHQQVNEIRWWVTERRYTLPLLSWIHLDKLYNKTYVDLEFESDTELGVEAGTYKGGVLGSGIKLNDEHQLCKLYMSAKKHPSKRQLLESTLRDRIHQFMNFDKLY